MASNNLYFKKNMITSLFNMIIQFLQSFLITAYVQRNMGVEAYGYISVVINIVNIAGVLTVALTSVSSRYMVVELQNNSDESKVSGLFSTLISATLFLALFCSIFFCIIITNLKNVMVVSDEYYIQVKILMIIVSIEFIVQLLQVPFLATIYYEERLYIYYGISILTNVAKIVSVVLIFNIWSPVIWAVYIGALIINIFSLIYYVIRTKSKYKNLIFSIKLFDFNKLKEILGVGIWVSLSKLAAILLAACSTYMVNILITPYYAGIYGSIAQLQSILSFMTTAIVTVFLPQMYKQYADNEYDKLTDYVGGGLNVISSVLGIVSGGLIVFGHYFMSIWITNEYMQYHVLIIISVSYLQISYSSEMLNQLLLTSNKTKYPAIISLVVGVINILMSIFFVKLFRLGIYGIAVSQLISLVLRSSIWMPLYTSKVFNKDKLYFIKDMYKGIISTLITIVIGAIVNNFIYINSWLTLIVSCVITGLLSVAILYMSNKRFKEFLLMMVKSKK